MEVRLVSATLINNSGLFTHLCRITGNEKLRQKLKMFQFCKICATTRLFMLGKNDGYPFFSNNPFNSCFGANSTARFVSGLFKARVNMTGEWWPTFFLYCRR